MPYGSRAKQFFDELVGQFRRRALLRSWGRRAVEILVSVRSGRKERVPAKLDAGTPLYLVSLGLVATAVVVVFFGLGFLLLAHPEDEALSAAGLDNRSAEAQASRSSGSLAQSSQAHEQTPPAPTRRTAPGALPDAFANSEVPNTSPEASSPEQPGLEPSEETATPSVSPGATHTKRTGIERHRHTATRKHWASIHRPETYGRVQPVSGPEIAWRWIVFAVAPVGCADFGVVFRTTRIGRWSAAFLAICVLV